MLCALNGLATSARYKMRARFLPGVLRVTVVEDNPCIPIGDLAPTLSLVHRMDFVEGARALLRWCTERIAVHSAGCSCEMWLQSSHELELEIRLYRLSAGFGTACRTLAKSQSRYKYCSISRANSVGTVLFPLVFGPAPAVAVQSLSVDISRRLFKNFCWFRMLFTYVW